MAGLGVLDYNLIGAGPWSCVTLFPTRDVQASFNFSSMGPAKIRHRPQNNSRETKDPTSWLPDPAYEGFEEMQEEDPHSGALRETSHLDQRRPQEGRI